MQYRILQGQGLVLRTLAGTAAALRAEALVTYDDGTTSTLTISTVTTSGSRVNEDWASSNVALKNGYVTFSIVQPVTVDLRRGQLWTRLAVGSIEDLGGILSQDYVYETHWATLGEMIDPGPGGGDGFLQLNPTKADGAPAATTTMTLRGTKAIRRYLGFAWYYKASADVATRTLDVALRKISIITALPTGWATESKADVWRAVGHSLIVSQEGTLWASEKISGKNTDGTVTQDSQSAAASPFPFLVRRDDLAELVFSVGSGNANDRDKIQVVYEEWLVP